MSAFLCHEESDASIVIDAPDAESAAISFVAGKATLACGSPAVRVFVKLGKQQWVYDVAVRIVATRVVE